MKAAARLEVEAERGLGRDGSLPRVEAQLLNDRLALWAPMAQSPGPH